VCRSKSEWTANHVIENAAENDGQICLARKMARLEGLEPPTLCFEGRCSIQLSYRRAVEADLILKHLAPLYKSNPSIFAVTV
jgi:hypothetical protein